MFWLLPFSITNRHEREDIIINIDLSDEANLIPNRKTLASAIKIKLTGGKGKEAICCDNVDVTLARTDDFQPSYLSNFISTESLLTM